MSVRIECSVFATKCGRSCACRAFSLASARALRNHSRRFDPAHAQSVRGEAERRHAEERERAEPRGLEEARIEPDRQRRARLVPHAVLVAGHDVKTIAARRDVREVRRPPRAGLRPRRLEPLEPIAEAHRRRIRVVEGGVAELEIVSARRQPDPPVGDHLLAAGQDLLDDDGGRHAVQLDAARIRHRESFERREPEPSVAAAADAVLAVVALGAAHAAHRVERRPGWIAPARATCASSDCRMRQIPRLLVSQK